MAAGDKVDERVAGGVGDPTRERLAAVKRTFEASRATQLGLDSLAALCRVREENIRNLPAVEPAQELGGAIDEAL
tara:strand:+ start:416 stop:640 length:225 start_codon:yes stop_codon:yes gene_type:complete